MISNFKISTLLWMIRRPDWTDWLHADYQIAAAACVEGWIVRIAP